MRQLPISNFCGRHPEPFSTRIELQEDFVGALSDSIDSGVGRLVDADMEEESSKLSALQTQQQLAIQSLSIANSSSQNILSLFRG